MTLAEIAEAVDGELAEADPAAVASGPVVLDSRVAEPGGLFVAVRGEHADGHDFARDAVDRGAVAVLASRPVAGVPCVVGPEPPPGSLTGEFVEGSVLALGRLARTVSDRLTGSGLVVVAVTGSQGKTTTKDLLAQLLSSQGEGGSTVAAEASLNTELGVPLTVLRSDAETRYLVVEMGARGIGHIAYYTGVVRPRIGAVLNVGSAHVGEFGSREKTAAAKGELVEALPSDGVAVLNADDELVRAMASRTVARVVLVGESPGADVRAEGVTLDDRGRAAFRLVTPEGAAEVRLDLVGAHQVGNALAAAAVGRAVGIPVDGLSAGLSGAVRRARWRMEVTDRTDGITVVNDAYNANPDSMHAALHTVRQLAGNRRTWAVLGEMLELGAASRHEHEAVGRLAVRLGVARLVVVGEGARPIQHGAHASGSWGEESEFVPDADRALELLRQQLRPGDVVLVKSSRDAGLRYLGDALLSLEDLA